MELSFSRSLGTNLGFVFVVDPRVGALRASERGAWHRRLGGAAVPVAAAIGFVVVPFAFFFYGTKEISEGKSTRALFRELPIKSNQGNGLEKPLETHNNELHLNEG